LATFTSSREEVGESGGIMERKEERDGKGFGSVGVSEGGQEEGREEEEKEEDEDEEEQEEEEEDVRLEEVGNKVI
jgi:hypothetical protein